jgi:alanyl-tRNA synthetase
MTAEEVSRVEALVNSWVGAASDVQTRVMALDDARAAGATAMFGEKYDDVVRVVDVPGVSMELCGGESSLGMAREGWSTATGSSLTQCPC